jgi:hypothetical protein
MITQLYQFKSLPDKYKKVLNRELNENQTVYVTKDVNGNPKSITTSVIEAIKKGQIKIS